MKSGIFKTNTAVTTPISIPLSNPLDKFGDKFQIRSPITLNGSDKPSLIQHDEDEPEEQFFLQSHDSLELNLEWGVYSPRKKNIISDDDQIQNNPYINQIIINKKRCSLTEASNPHKGIGTTVETFTGIKGNNFDIKLEKEIDRYLNIDIEIEDIFGNKDSKNLILRNTPASGQITSIYESGGFAHVECTGSSDFMGVNLYGFTGTNIYGKLEESEEFKSGSKITTLNANDSAKIPIYPKKRFHIMAFPYDSAGESRAISLREGEDVESPSGFFFSPSHDGVNMIKKDGGTNYELEYNYDWEENPFVEVRYKLYSTGSYSSPVLGYENNIALDCGYLNDPIGSDSQDSKKLLLNNSMDLQRKMYTGNQVETATDIFAQGGGEMWEDNGPRYSGESGMYSYAYIDVDKQKIICATYGQIDSGLCPVNGAFSMPINEPNSPEINFRQGENFRGKYEKASTYLKEINEMPAVLLNKTQLNKVKQFNGAKGWVGLRRNTVGCLDELFSTKIQNQSFFDEVDILELNNGQKFLDKNKENRHFRSNDVGDLWSWVNSSGDHIYKYAGYSDMNVITGINYIEAEYVNENRSLISTQTQEINFTRPKIINAIKSSQNENITITYDLENSNYSGNVSDPYMTHIEVHTGSSADYIPSSDSLFQTITPQSSEDIERIHHSATIAPSGNDIENIKLLPYDNLGSGQFIDLSSQIGLVEAIAFNQIIEHSLDENHYDGTTSVSVPFPVKAVDPKITFGISMKNQEVTPSFLNAMIIGEPTERGAEFLLSQAPPHTGYCLTLSIMAGDNTNY